MPALRLQTPLTAALAALTLLGGLTTMAAAQQAASEAPTALSETYGDWVVRCATPATVEGQPAPARQCEVTQELRQQDSNQRVMALSLRKGAEADTGALTVVAPFGLLLSAGVLIDVGETPLLELGFQTCLPAGCIALSDMTTEEITAMAAGETAAVVFTDTSNQPLSLNVSLEGFAAAWNRLKGL